MNIGDISVELHPARGNRVMYMLMPMSPDPAWIASQAARLGVSIAVITGMDWDNDLTPWPAPGQPPGEPDFQGLAPRFLALLTSRLLPSVENRLGLKSPDRTLCGISLSGLFAVWARTQTTVFRNIISVSGSFWYENFPSWLRTVTIPQLPSTPDSRDPGKIYLSLGNKEANTPVLAFRSVATATASVTQTLRADGLDVTFRSVPGNHYQHAQSRLLLAFSAIFGPF